MTVARYESPSGLRFHLNANGSIARIEHADITLNTYLGTEVEGGLANLYLRRLDGEIRHAPLLGPTSPAAFDVAEGRLSAAGVWDEIEFRLELRLADSVPAWFWHVTLRNLSERSMSVDLVHAQDLSLAHYGAIRNNEYYTSQYVDWTPLEHPARGMVLAVRQNLSMGGHHPWAVLGTLGRTVSYATDALQLHGLAARASAPSPGLLAARLEGRRRQHEHAMAVLQHAPLLLEPGRPLATGFFGRFEPHHEAASAPADLAIVDATLALPEAEVTACADTKLKKRRASGSLFSRAGPLCAEELTDTEITKLFGSPRREEELSTRGLLSFFVGADRHVALRAKELEVLRPHGHILRTGAALVPDEAALSSTVWMCGVFNSLFTQGHVNINRFIAATHGYLNLSRADGQRIFVETPSGYRLLDLPSAFEMSPRGCRWIYKHEGALIEVSTTASLNRHEINVVVSVLAGAPLRCLVSTRIALNGDDGAVATPLLYARDRCGVVFKPQPDSEIGRRFPKGSFRVDFAPGTDIERIGGDELLYENGASRGEPFVVLVTAPATAAAFRITGHLIESGGVAEPGFSGRPMLEHDHAGLGAGWIAIRPPAASSLAADVARLEEILPWFAENALVHYLAPHGLEQYAGGGWGTRDVCQGPVELLLAFGEHAVLRDLLLRVFAAQNPDGDWPQWFMFYDRERGIRAPDSHGDIVFWPLLALGEYLVATEDASILEESLPFFHVDGAARAETATLGVHVERALAVISRRVIRGTRLAAYGNGDWNDSLQPADPAMKERLTSAWTVALHYHTLRTLAAGLRTIGRADDAMSFEQDAKCVLGDFRRLLVIDGTVAGLAYFHDDARIEPYLHPRDRETGISYSLLPMIHSILHDLFTPEEAQAHLEIIRSQLLAADGARLFDRPSGYQGGLQRMFQRAESSSFFGREIGLMYTHAHLRYAEAMAHYGDADAFFLALCQANPIAIRAVVPTAALRQANCYYSSSDADFADRYEASARYPAVRDGAVPFEGGWRVYSSGAGIAVRLIHERFLGVERRKSTLVVDPVIPIALDGLEVDLSLDGERVTVRYHTGSKGRGPVALSLNGRDLAFERLENPYRTGAAKVSMATLRERLTAGPNLLEITLE